MVAEIFQTLPLFPRSVCERYVQLRAEAPIRAAAVAAMAEHLDAAERRVLLDVARQRPISFTDWGPFGRLVRLGVVASYSLTRVGLALAMVVDSDLRPS